MKIKFTLFLLFISLFSFAQDINDDLDEVEVSLDIAQIQQTLNDAPIFDINQNRRSKKEISIPILDGDAAQFYVYETISMEEPLYSKFPQIRSYILINKSDPSHRGRLSTGSDQIRIMTKHNGQQEFIEPIDQNNKYKIYKGTIDKSNMTCGVDELEQQITESQDRSAQTTFTNGTTLRTYRMAIATAGEFYNEFGGTTKNTSNDALVLVKINNYLNLLNDIFEDELAVHFNLIGNNTAIMFADPVNDGLDPNNRVGSSQTVINNTILAPNYDIGHTFYTIPPPAPPFAPCCSTSGVAFVGAICNNNFKGGAWTGASGGTPDGLFMGTFAHEIGHQFGASHSYYGTESNCFQRQPGSGYEPGSGNSLMSYEGICAGQNITPTVSTLYFHNNSLDQMITEINSTSCHTSAPTANSVPVTTAPINKTIPRGTPFELEGSSTDADGDVIYYNWEQYDTDNLALVQNDPLGNPQVASVSTTAPLFRSFDPSLGGNIRVYPQISDIVNNTQTQGEILPQVSRNMKFRLTSRDFNTAGGAVSCAEVDITVDGTVGPFNVTSQSSATTWVANGSNTATITWSVAGTDAICSNVDILFSTDRGLTFPFTIASNVANDGSQLITIPNHPTSIGRIKVKCSDNYFFDINEEDIELTSNCFANGATFSPSNDISAAAGDPSLNLGLSPNFDSQVVFPFSGSISGTETPTSASNASFQCGTSNCSLFGGNTFRYDNFDIHANVAGTYTFAISSNFSAALQFFEGPFNVNAGCNNLLGISRCHNLPNTVTGTVSNVTVTLTPGIMYSLAVSNFFFGTQTGNYTISLVSAPAGAMLYDGPNIPSGSGFSYTYVVVNTANNTIVGFESSSDLTSTLAGNYDVYGLSYDSNATLNTGGSFDAFQSDIALLAICGSLSLNKINVTITGSSNCPPDYAGANALTGTETATQDYESDGAIESTQLINGSATVDYDSGTSITLEAPFQVQLGANFNAFIDGCGGAMLQEDSTEENK